MPLRLFILALVLAPLLGGPRIGRASPGLAPNELAPDSFGMLRTGLREGHFELAPGVGLTLAPNTEVRVFTRPQELPLMAGPLIKTWTVIVRQGTASVSVAEQQRKAVLIHDEDRRGGICLGGELVLGTQARETSVANLRGHSVSIGKGRIGQLPEGKEGKFLGEAAPLLQDLTLAPTLTVTQALWFAPQGKARVQGLKVTGAPSSGGYELVIRREGERAPVLRQRGTSLKESPALALAPGRYLAAARAISPLGIPSGLSKELLLQVVGVELPEGATLDEHARITLSGAQTVRFTFADDLWLSHTGAKSSQRATLPVGLHNNQLTAVALLHPGTIDSVTAQLVPSARRVHLKLGPGLASWPKDPISIEISVSGPGASAYAEELEPRVMLGLTPVEVSWQRQGANLSGSVAAQRLTGPQVLRVEVRDASQALLARDFLELIPTPPGEVNHSLDLVARH